MDKEGSCCSQQLRSEGWWKASWLPVSVNMWVLTLPLALADGFLRLSHWELQRPSEACQVGCECAGVLWAGEGLSCQGAVPWHTGYLTIGERVCSWEHWPPLPWRTVTMGSRGGGNFLPGG